MHAGNQNDEELSEHEVLTPTVLFVLKVSQNHNGDFVARIDGQSPPLLQQAEAVERSVLMKILNPVEIRDVDREQLIRRSKARMTALGGKINSIIRINSKARSYEDPVSHLLRADC